MTLPDKLIQVAAEAIRLQSLNAEKALTWLEVAECALTAAFATLDTCSKAVEVVTRHVSNRHAYEERKKALIYLTREFGELTP